MFEFIRTHRRLTMFLLMLIVVPSFALVGISGYQNSNDASTIAKVGGVAITQQQWEQAQRQQMDRYRQILGERFDQKMFDTAEVKQSIFDNLVAERALGIEAVRQKLTVSDQALQAEISQIPGLVTADGKFDFDRYKGLLAAQGMTPEMYDARLRRDMAMQQLSAAIQTTAFTPRTVTSRLSDIRDQEREVQELMFPVEQFVSQVKVSDAMVKDFYDKNGKLFEIAEQVKIEYVILNSATVGDQVSVSDADVSQYYDENQQRFTTDETRRVSHILVTVKKDASAAEKTAAKAQAESILAEVRKAPADFAKIAKAKSQDPASAELGGDLNVMQKGSLPKAMEDVAYGLALGQISDLVVSDFGFHILTITALKPATVQPLQDVKAQIAVDLKAQKAAKKYSESVELFTNTVYEQSDSLKPVADKLKLKVETAANLSRTPLPGLGAAPYNNAKFLQAIFSDEALKNKRNTEAVEVAPNTLISGRVVEFKPVSKRPLSEVDTAIRQSVTQVEALKLAKNAGEAKLTALRDAAAGDVSGFGASKVVSRRNAQGTNDVAMVELLKANVSKLPTYVGVDVPGQGYGIYRISKVQQPANVDAARRTSEREQIASVVAQQEMYGYIEALKLKAKVKIVKPVVATTADDKAATGAR
ncbi:MAG: peptidyl-prolyl cis-trans isomerase D [Janthinobacterium sp.]|jgi:peptidyl-prolyl cis-trans isomerase D